jgi:hypothetical protein
MSVAASPRVALVLVDEFPDLPAFLKQMPVWMVESEANLAAMHRLFDEAGALPAGYITTFPLREGETAALACERIVLSLDEHHDRTSSADPYGELIIIGVTLGQVSLQPFLDCGFDAFTVTGDGFTATKSVP